MLQEKEADYERFLKSAANSLEKTEPGKLRDVLKQLIEEWKTLGKIRPEKHSEFWGKFQQLTKNAQGQARKLQNQRNASGEESEKQKRALLEKLENLSQQLAPVVNLNQVRKDWRNTGFVAKKLNDELNDQFQKVTGLLSEKIFLNQLLEKKARKGMSADEKDKLRIKLLYDLLNRDVNELQTFELNVEKFTTAKGLDNLLDQKLDQQRRKVEIKRELLKQLKSVEKRA